jgi:hypothetical protein
VASHHKFFLYAQRCKKSKIQNVLGQKKISRGPHGVPKIELERLGSGCTVDPD